MALLFLDSFDHYLDCADKYLSGGLVIVPGGRHGSGLSGEVRCAPTPTSPRVILGGAFKFGTTFVGLYELFDIDHQICSVQTANDGALEVEMIGGPTVRTPADLVRVHQWHYLEVDLTITVSASRYACSSAQLILDGALVLNTPIGPGSANVATPSAIPWTHVDVLWLVSQSVVDDFYICDGAGPAPWNAPLGDIEIDVIRPNGVGASTQWVPVGAATNWDATNDLTPDDETTRVTAATTGLSDLYAMEDIFTNNGIIGAQLLINARRTAEGPAALTPQLRHAGTTTDLVARSLSPSYFYRNRDVFVTMPNGDPLTDANVNALQAGFKRSL